ncbi:uncharacterized protein FYW47_012140 [Aplochiton taeniatus]
MRVHCLNPNRATCEEVARAIVSQYPATIADKTADDEFMRLTYLYQRHMINSWPAPTLCEIKEQWPFLFTERGICTHFHTLTGIESSSTKISVEMEETLPTTPRIIMLGTRFLSATRWMVSMEGKVFCKPEQLHDSASAFAVFFGSYYVFNLEYQESASTTLEMQRFFVRINPDVGTKCTAKVGTSRKTGSVVKRKVTRITTFLQRLTEFEWRTSN